MRPTGVAARVLNISATVTKTGNIARAFDVDRLGAACVPAAKAFVRGVQTAMGAQNQAGPTQRALTYSVEIEPASINLYVNGPPALHWVIHGRGPGGLPPFDRMAQWARRKAYIASPKGLASARGYSHIGYGGHDQAFINMAFAIQRTVHLRRTPNAYTTVKQQMLIPGMDLATARQVTRGGIGAGNAPPLQRIIDWMTERDIQPTQAEAFTTYVNNLRYAIAKRGTRRFRLEVPDPVKTGIDATTAMAIRVIFERWR